MCRGKSQGGRRCAGCDDPKAREAHNARRRRNRELKREIVEEARRQGVAGDVVAELEAKPPAAAKEWARAHGLPSRFHPGNGHADAAPAAGLGAPAVPVAPADGPEWMTPTLASQIAAARDVTGSHRDERSLLDGAVRSTSRAAGGTNTTTRVELTNGMTGYHKPFNGLNDHIAKGFGQSSAQQCIHEVAAWRVASAMGEPWEGLVPPVVLREFDGELGSFALERPGLPNRKPKDSPEWRHAAFFDTLIGQQDRHRANYLVAGDRLVLIDHGYSFAVDGDFVNFSDFQQTRLMEGFDDPNAHLLTGAEIDVLDRFLADDTRFGLRGLLEEDRLSAIEERARKMRSNGRLLGVGDLGRPHAS